MADLADVPLGDLMKELQRRLECTAKPKKHLILIGGRGGCWMPLADHTHTQAAAAAAAALWGIGGAPSANGTVVG
jgi:hypothetical protein